MLMRKFYKLKKDNKGSAIVMVMVAVAFVAILIATLFWVTMSNFFMKYSDTSIKNNFYSSETVLEQMKAGLQKEASDALMDTYDTALSSYAEGNGELYFESEYLTKVYSDYKDTAEPNKFSIERLTDYVDADLMDSANYRTVVTGTYGTKSEIQKTGKEVQLKNVTVEFTNMKTGYVSVITTDFAIGIPNIGFTKSMSLPDLFDYAIIANDSFRVTNGTKADIHKSVYGGQNGISIGTGIDASGAKGAVLDMSDASYVVTNTTISVNGAAKNDTDGRANFITGKDTSLYSKDIELHSANVTLNGKSFVADDLVYGGGTNSKLQGGGRVSISGDYYGYGNSLNDPEQSSAILINESNSELDLSALDKIVLAGHAYVGTSDKSGISVNKAESLTLSENKSDVLMDQSIAVKGDQVAYLIPGDCIGVWKNNDGTTGDTIVGMNPVPNITLSRNAANGAIEPYFDIYKSDGGYVPNGYDMTSGSVETVDFDRSNYSLGGRPLSYYSSEYQVIYKRQYGQNMAYFYLVMDENKAKEYMTDYYGVKKGSLDKYYSFYMSDAIKDPDQLGYQIDTSGHFISELSGNGIGLNGANTSAALQTGLNIDASQTFKGMCAKLVKSTSGLSSAELSGTIFSNIMNTAILPGVQTVYKVGSGTDVTRAVFTPADYVYGDHSYDDTVCLIISKGNVTVKKDFSGLIIARGKVTVEGDVSVSGGKIDVTGNRDKLAMILQSSTLEDGSTAPKTPIEYFNDSSKYVLDGTSVSSNGTVSSDEIVDFGDVVSYENWTKK